MNINWSLLGGAPNIGEAFQTGLRTAQRNALEQTEVAHRMDERRRATGLRDALAGAYNPATGQIDPTRARAAYVQAGDVAGAMEFDENRVQQQTRVTEAQREQIRLGARIISAVQPTDDASWQRVRQLAQQAGIDLANVPPTFDQEYISNVIAAGQALESPDNRRPVTVGRGERLVDPISGRQIAEGAPPEPNYIALPPGGRLVLEPGTGGPSMPSSTDGTPPPQSEAELRAAAAEAIRQGADPTQVNQRLDEMLRGGAGPAGPRTFPQ